MAFAKQTAFFIVRNALLGDMKKKIEIFLGLASLPLDFLRPFGFTDTSWQPPHSCRSEDQAHKTAICFLGTSLVAFDFRGSHSRYSQRLARGWIASRKRERERVEVLRVRMVSHQISKDQRVFILED